MSWNAAEVTSYVEKLEKTLGKGDNICTVLMDL